MARRRAKSTTEDQGASSRSTGSVSRQRKRNNAEEEKSKGKKPVTRKENSKGKKPIEAEELNNKGKKHKRSSGVVITDPEAEKKDTEEEEEENEFENESSKKAKKGKGVVAEGAPVAKRARKTYSVVRSSYSLRTRKKGTGVHDDALEFPKELLESGERKARKMKAKAEVSGEKVEFRERKERKKKPKGEASSEKTEVKNEDAGEPVGDIAHDMSKLTFHDVD